ncbi:dihydropteridine reductase [Angomonas deanei]|nr:dihydropteridine reductase [Angomonas deanei]EPY40154.1 dihydropteridine reductase [Angomonas deanei]|eukprot:EPY36370.1 dihydropteridine reductase [Angomonas deanei]
MLKQSVLSSVLASHLFATKADESSLLVLTGASASLQPTPSMIGYGMSKAAVHFLTKSLASDPRLISRGDSVLCILPSTLDTEANRLGMPDADRSSWTPLDDVSSALWKWAEGTDLPASGSLVGFKTQQGKTTRVIQ